MKFSTYLLSITLLLFGCKLDSKNNKKIETEIPEHVNVHVNNMKEEVVEFESADGLMIQGIFYSIDSTMPLILLCHQADFNKYEYVEIAPKLVQQGFNCLAIDQRSGGKMNSYENVTYNRAKEKKLNTEYIDAEQDILAAIEYAYALKNQKIILWGSSYSASLCIKLGALSDKVKAIVAFSPGEYFPDPNYIKSSVNKLDKPIFAASTEKESGGVGDLLNSVDQSLVTYVYPESKGTHGSKALWNSDSANGFYWNELLIFLQKNK